MLGRAKHAALRFTIFLVFATVNCSGGEENVKLTLKQGVLSGTLAQTFVKKQSYYSFRGIPFAEPPLGALRFQPPKPLASWDGTYRAHSEKPTCMQGNARMRNDEKSGVSGSEDCLYLNVYTPSLEDALLPVIVFDYNDNFRTGFNGTQTYSPDFFLEEEVIVVTIRHRLGLFGYLTTDDGIIPPNAGLKDFILGLQWVRNNIKHFGGDPDRVTLVGSRGGAVLADMLLYSKKAKGLFSAVALQSGSSFEAIFFPENPRKAAFDLGTSLDINTEDSKVLLEELQQKDATDLLLKEHHAFDNELAKTKQMDIYPFSPVIEPEGEDSILTSKPESAKVVNDVPIIVGFNSREGLDLIQYFILQPKLVSQVQEFLFHFPVRTNFRFDRNSTVYEQALDEIRTFYLGDGYLHAKSLLEYAVYVGDLLQMFATDYAVEKLSKEVQSPVYYYMFDYRGSINENTAYLSRRSIFSLRNWGATITDELCYLHLCARIKKMYEELYSLASEQPEQKVIKRMVRMWSNFAKTRNPTPANDTMLKGLVWKPVDKTVQEKSYLHIGKKSQMKVNPLGDRETFWDQFLDKYAAMAVDGVVNPDPVLRDEF